MSDPVSSKDRHSRRNRCPVCDGAEGDPRGSAKRCTGFTQGGWARCSREEFRGALEADRAGLYHHRVQGPCPCGSEHAPAPVTASATYGEIEATYDYQDESGVLIFQVVRKSGKRFSQRKPDGAGGWVYKLADIRRVPYRLPRLLAADPSRTVYIVEGEKDVECLERAGELATCNPGGAGKWRFVQDAAAPALRGRTVVVVADRDKPGLDHAHDVAARVRGVATSVTIKAPPEPHKDASDLLGSGGRLEDLITVDDRDEVVDTSPPASSAPPKMPEGMRVVDPENRPDLEITPMIHNVTDQMAVALATYDDALYQRSGDLCHVVRSTDDDQFGTAVGSPVVRSAPVSWLRNRVSRVVRCGKWARSSKGHERFVPCAPPKDCVTAVAEAGEWRGVRRLRGVVEAPVMRADGSILQAAGYDAPTGYLYEPNAAFLPVDEAPTHSDAVLAYARLSEPLREFPYVSDAHRSAVIAAVLTLLARPAIDGAVPAWVFDASARRSGKSLQVDVVHLITTGRPASRMTFPEDDTELEKVLSAYAMMGARSVNFDNVARKFGGASLDKVITAVGSVDLRVLGASDLRTCEWYATIFASGNNVSFGGDMIARVLAPRLETSLDRPELLDPAIKDLRAWVRERRVDLVHSALTLLRAYVVAGRPDMGCPRWGGFEAWSRLIPHALAWVGAADPMGARRGLEGDTDPDELAHAGLVAGWARLCFVHAKPEGLTIKQALTLLYPADRHESAPDGFDDLREVIENLTNARPGFPPAGKALADKIRRWRDKPTGGKRLTGQSASAGTVRWSIR